VKFDAAKKLLREDMPDAPAGEWLDKALESINRNNEQTAAAFQGGISFAGNTTSGYLTERFTHGVEKKITNPLKVRPVGIEAVRVIQVAGGSAILARPDVSWKFVAGSDPKAQDQIAITCAFPPPPNKLRVYKTSDQAIPHNNERQVTWDATDFVIGTFAYTTAGVFTAPESGILDLRYVLQLDATGVAAGDYLGGFWRNTTQSNKRYGSTRMGVPTAAGGTPMVTGAGLASVTKGDTLTVQARQGNAGGLDKNLDSDSTIVQGCFAELSYVSPLPSYTADVVLFFHGG
jgi:hypothetical protein